MSVSSKRHNGEGNTVKQQDHAANRDNNEYDPFGHHQSREYLVPDKISKLKTRYDHETKKYH
jgi:hypothetical protein